MTRTTDKSFKKEFFSFAARLNRTLARTVTPQQLVPKYLPRGKDRSPQGLLAFRSHGRGGAAHAWLESKRFGRLGLYLGQICEPKEDSRFPLQTTKYTYTLETEGAEEAFLRWEYVKRPEAGKTYCRHHVQGELFLNVRNETLSLKNEIHLPTGYVTVEEVIRFCITDLEVPALSGDWHDTLEEGYETFKAKAARPRSR